jgi:hypothetical protein
MRFFEEALKRCVRLKDREGIPDGVLWTRDLSVDFYILLHCGEAL